MKSFSAMGTPFQHKVVCVMEWILTGCLVGFTVASLLGLLDSRYLYDAVSSIIFPCHRPPTILESAEEAHLYRLILNLEIFLLIAAQNGLSFLLLMAIEKNSKEMYKIWSAVHIFLTFVICFPLFYQYLFWTPLESSEALAANGSKEFSLNGSGQKKANIKMAVSVVWACYRVITLLLVGCSAGGRCFQQNTKTPYLGF